MLKITTKSKKSSWGQNTTLDYNIMFYHKVAN